MRLFLALAASAALCAQGASLEDDFLAAREAFRAANARALETYAKRFEGHLLEPYLGYWRLALRLERARPEEVRDFLARYRDSPLSERLRLDWLRLLGKNEQWELFEQELPALGAEDLEIACYALRARARREAPEALREARSLWFVPRELPEACTPLFDALAASGALAAEDVWVRIRIALEAGRVSRARRAAEYLPAVQRPPPRLLEEIAADPARFLELGRFALESRAGREAVLFAVHRLARTSPRRAAAHWSRIEQRFSREEREYVWGLVAQLGAMRHDPDALVWYARAGDLSDAQLAWKVRAALRAGAWAEALAAIEAMSEKESLEPAWRYWKARALAQLGRAEEAREILVPLAADFGFYGQLALEELGGAVAFPAPLYRPAPAEVQAVAGLAGIRRALALYRLGLRPEANREWLWAIRGFDDRRLLAAAEVARRHEIYDRAINTAERTVELHDFALRYLAPYRELLAREAARFGLEPAWVYGLVRQESRFVATARSRAGAGGLMQLMPATARWVAKKLGLRDWRWSQLYEPDFNVTLGTYYLRHVLDLLDGQPLLASAAYNAGPGRARAWRPDTPLEGAIYAETIPFNETREYVKKVMANASYYAQLFNDGVRSLKARLGIVAPRRAEAEPPLGDTP